MKAGGEKSTTLNTFSETFHDKNLANNRRLAAAAEKCFEHTSSTKVAQKDLNTELWHSDLNQERQRLR